MRTKCKNCIFGAFEDNKQVGCVLGKLDIYKEQGTDISRELVETTGREYYVINDRYCMACRNEKWLESLPEGTDHVKKMEEESAIQCQIVLFHNSTIDDLLTTCYSIERQSLKPKKVTIVDRPESSQQDEFDADRAERIKSIMKAVDWLDVEYEVRAFTEMFSDGKCIDMCVETVRPQYYCVVQSGCVLPDEMLEEVNTFVTKKLVRFSLIAADEHNNYMVVPHAVHCYLNGNVGKPLIEKLKEQEWEESIYPIQMVCPSVSV
tara:strand:+ start:1247 stop:2035 length:789 start_codon:yes stop_codon:yes gene_type:complete